MAPQVRLYRAPAFRSALRDLKKSCAPQRYSLLSCRAQRYHAFLTPYTIPSRLRVPRPYTPVHPCPAPACRSALRSLRKSSCASLDSMKDFSGSGGMMYPRYCALTSLCSDCVAAG